MARCRCVERHQPIDLLGFNDITGKPFTLRRESDLNPQATAGAPAIEQYRVKDTELSNPDFLLAPRVVVPAGHVDDVNSSKDGSSA